ncbi:MAG: anti-sigma factor antagonist, partial [Planctomycetia bacterium]|nr:anti-sigma factor antagonist [Planctomycetia bacterium]
MDISIERRPNDAASGRDAAVVVLAVAGRIDAETGAELRHAVAEELRRGGHAIRLDCAGVRFLSSAGIRVLFDVHRAAKTAGGTCLIGAASEPVARVLELTRLAPLLMESRQASGPERQPEAGPRGGTTSGRDLRVGRVVLVGLEPSGVAPLAAEVIACGA